MHGVTGSLELSALNLELAAAYLKDAEGGFRTVADSLESCLRTIKVLKDHPALWEAFEKPRAGHDRGEAPRRHGCTGRMLS